MKSARGVARLAPSAVNPPKWSFAWAQASASADRHPRHTRSRQPLWQHEPRVPTKICITRAHLLYSAPAGGSSVSETTPPTQADRTGHPPRKLLANSRTSANPPWEDATRPQSPLARTQSLNTSAIRTLVPDLIPGWFNNGCICWLRCAPQQYTLQGYASLVALESGSKRPMTMKISGMAHDIITPKNNCASVRSNRVSFQKLSASTTRPATKQATCASRMSNASLVILQLNNSVICCGASRGCR